MPNNPNGFNNGPQNNETAGEVDRTREQNLETGERTNEAYIEVKGKTPEEVLQKLSERAPEIVSRASEIVEKKPDVVEKKDVKGMTVEELQAELAAINARIAKKEKELRVQNAARIVNEQFPDTPQDEPETEEERQARLKEAAENAKRQELMYEFMPSLASQMNTMTEEDERKVENLAKEMANKSMAGGEEEKKRQLERAAKGYNTAVRENYEEDWDADVAAYEQKQKAPTVQEVLEKSKKHRGFKDWVRTTVALACVAILGAAAATDFFGVGKSNNMNATNTTTFEAEPDPAPERTDPNDDRSTGDIEKQVEDLRNDSYKMPGNWLDKGKKGEGYSFSNAYEVGQRCGNDAKEIVKYVANQEEALSAYINEMDDKSRPAGFSGLDVNEIAIKIEKMSDEEFKALKEEFDQKIDSTETHDIKISGRFWNYYMAFINEKGAKIGSKDARFNDPNAQISHEDMQLVGCKTDENRIVKEFIFKDENGVETGRMIIKITPIYDKNGNLEGYSGCAQPLSEIEIGVEEITPTATPTPTGEEDPTPTPKKEEDPTPTPKKEEDPTPTPKSKNPERTEDLDEQFHEDNADDINTGEINVDQTKTDEVENKQEKTDKPTNENSDFGLDSPIGASDAAKETNEGEGSNEGSNGETTAEPTAEPVQAPEKVDPADLSEENNYSENRGGANESAEPQVTADPNADKEANEGEMSKEEADNMTDDEFADIMSGF